MTDCRGKEYDIVNVGNATDIIGQSFGDLTVVNRVKMRATNRTEWLCVCRNCGNEICVTAGHLNDGSTTSCGCKKKKENKEIERLLNGLSSDN